MGEGEDAVQSQYRGDCLCPSRDLYFLKRLHELQEINGVWRKHGVMRVDMVQSNLTAELSY